MWTRVCLFLSVFAAVPLSLFAAGEPTNGFPKWEERVIQEWTNRARSDPQYEMTQCGAACGDHACYAPIAPLGYLLALNRSSRFHADYMALGGAIAHDTNCTLNTNINSIYPSPCNGARSCACSSLSGTTSWITRIGYFGVSTLGENWAYGGDPNTNFYLWMYESTADATCSFHNTGDNGHRWNILTINGSMGAGWGVNSSIVVQDFGGGAAPTKIVSGSHYPQQASAIDFWANWYDSAAPRFSNVVIDGMRYPMWRLRGSATNGAWNTNATAFGAGCHRYFFNFTDNAGTVQKYPTTGTYGIGSPSTCPDYAVPMTITVPASVAAGSANVATVPAHAGSTYAWTLTGGSMTAGQGTSTLAFTAGAAGTRMAFSAAETPVSGGPAAGTAFVMSDFADVPPANSFHNFIVTLAANSVTGGCGSGLYCPNDFVTRAQMAVFLLRAKYGEGLVLPAATGTMFTDVPANAFAATYIERLATEQVTGGCIANPPQYCPSAAVTRAQMAIFLLRAKYGSSYVPPAATGIFADVPVGSFGANYIERLYAEGITGGCGTNPLRYCPNDGTTRGAMAVFLTKTFGLQ